MLPPSRNVSDRVGERGTETPEITRLRQIALPDDPEACYALGEQLLASGSAEAAEEATRWFAAAAMKDHPSGHYQMALHYRGLNFQGMAGYHLAAAAEQGYLPAQSLLKKWKLEGSEPFENDEEALRMLEDGVREGNNDARYQLAVRLTQGCGVARDPQRGALLFGLAAQAGHAAAMYGLAVCYQNGYRGERDGEDAFYWLSMAAERGCAEAWYALGVIYRSRADYENAAECFVKAADGGNADALMSLALAYGRGEGVRRDANKMRRLIAEAAEKDVAEAEYWLGTYYRFGEGDFPQDAEKAVVWFERAAAHEHPEGTYGLAVHTLLGRGVAQDFETGWALLEKAAWLGVVDAMLALGEMIDRGEVLPDDPEQALFWYRMAAEKGNVEAQFLVGQRLLEKRNDRRLARQYLEKAAAGGHAGSQELLGSIGPDC